MRREELYLWDIVEAAETIGRFLAGVVKDVFLQSDLRQSAVLQKLMVIGEAASRLPADFRSRHPEIEWEDIVGFRNIAVHAYFSVQWPIVWITATQDAQDLKNKNKITAILDAEFKAPQSGPG